MRKRYLSMTVHFVAMCGTSLMCAVFDLLWFRAIALVAFVLLAISSISLAVKLDRTTCDQGDCK